MKKPILSYKVCYDGHYTHIVPCTSEPDGHESFRTYSEAKAELVEYCKDHMDGWRHALKQARALRKSDVLAMDAEV